MNIKQILIGALALALPLHAGILTNVSIYSVSSEFSAGFDLRAIHAVDNSGLSGSPAGHAVTDITGNSWQTISQTGNGDIQFDLGRVCQLTNVHVWNLNFYAPYNGRGANQVTIRTSTNAVVWNTEGTYGFTQASGMAGDLGFDINPAGWQPARYVDFQILNNFGSQDNAGHVGLSEVQFSAVPASTTSTLVISSLSGNGELSWSNHPGAAEYRVEWASTPDGVWSSSWKSLNAIAAAGSTYTVQVPMFYRLVAIMSDYARLLLHGDGTNGAISFPDAAHGHAVAAFGDVQVSATQSRFGGSAILFDGTGDYLEIANAPDFEPGNQAFTVDFWMYPLDNGNSSYLIGKSAPDAGQGYDIRFRDNTIVLVGVNGWAENIISDASVSSNAWHHVAVSSTTNTVYLFIDGSQKGTCPRANIPGQDIPLRIGRTSAYGGAAFHGYMDEIRFSLGVARWTNSFAAPAAPYVDD
jgi:hypothetical protein